MESQDYRLRLRPRNRLPQNAPVVRQVTPRPRNQGGLTRVLAPDPIGPLALAEPLAPSGPLAPASTKSPAPSGPFASVETLVSNGPPAPAFVGPTDAVDVPPPVAPMPHASLGFQMIRIFKALEASASTRQQAVVTNNMVGEMLGMVRNRIMLLNEKKNQTQDTIKALVKIKDTEQARINESVEEFNLIMEELTTIKLQIYDLLQFMLSQR